MAILPTTSQVPTCHHQCRSRTRVTCSATTITSTKPSQFPYLARTHVSRLHWLHLTDLRSGVFHWGIDNYGDASTPIFSSQIEALQGHQKWPWTFTRHQFARLGACHNVHSAALCSASSSMLGLTARRASCCCIYIGK
ncbi:hypothetical protein QYF36_007247 [Acer negundo]|nr:hypothetical protein QYF36_007247 [Acer negundo]